MMRTSIKKFPQEIKFIKILIFTVLFNIIYRKYSLKFVIFKRIVKTCYQNP